MGVAALSLDGVDKSFDGNRALEQASVHIEWGEVHALLGENGAGKSTLMNIVCGLYSADDGSVKINGNVANIKGPADATHHGIGMVHQHFKLVGPFSVAENVLLACHEKLGNISLEEVANRITEAAGKLGFDIDVHARTDTLSVAERQRIEIIKLILLGADILILDEPTAVLTDEESDAVLSLLREMASQGKAVVLITHRLREVTRFADRVTIMRSGKTVLESADAGTMDQSDLALAMVGESLGKDSRKVSSSSHRSEKTSLSLENVCMTRANGSVALSDVSLDLRQGEILGIAGVGGNGQPELTEIIYGMSEMDSGRILLGGKDISNLSIRERRSAGLRLVPADRFDFSLLAEFRAYENLAATEVPNGKFGSTWKLSRARMKQHAKTLFAERDITGGNPRTLSRLLSGGNAQKLLLARELAGDLDRSSAVLIAHSPTRGLDVRACEAVHRSIIESVENQASCVLISEDLDEVLALSNRIAVISRGVLHGPYNAEDISRGQIGELMAGHA